MTISFSIFLLVKIIFSDKKLIVRVNLSIYFTFAEPYTGWIYRNVANWRNGFDLLENK